MVLEGEKAMKKVGLQIVCITNHVHSDIEVLPLFFFFSPISTIDNCKVIFSYF